MDAEIIEFVRPEGRKSNLYITGISTGVDVNDLHDFLYENFSPFGLIHGIQVIDTSHNANDSPESSEATHSTKPTNSTFGNLYAFVNYYSSDAALEARFRLTGRLYLAGQHLKVQYTREKASTEPQPLYITKCYELANHYLGFNSWETSILMIRQNEEHTVIKPNEVQFVSGVKLLIKEHGLTTEGYGVATMSFDPADLTTKSVAYCRAKKQAYSQAVQNAFRHVLLVVLDNGKVYAEANSTVEERVYCDEQLTTDNVLKVNDLDVNPLEDDDDFGDSIDMDALNKQLLEELEEENS